MIQDRSCYRISTKNGIDSEGFDREVKKYIGAKWGKYLRAPEIFFKILEKGKSKLVPLKDVANVRRGFTTGANEFFYLTEEEIKQKRIEKEFWMHKDEKGIWVPNKVIVSPREGKEVIIDPADLKRIVLFINKDKNRLKGKNVLTHINHGEENKLNKRPTCDSRGKWYELEIREPWPILYPMIHKDRQLVISNKYKVQVDHNLFEIKPKRKRDSLPLLCFLLSTVSMLFKEFFGRTYGGGTGPVKTEGIDVERLPIVKEYSKDVRIKLRKLTKKYQNPEIKPVFEDLQAYSSEEVAFDKVRPDRRELDKIIMGEILGLTDEEQLEVYRAVVDLVKSRIEKAKSVKSNKTVEGINVDSLKNAAIERIDKETE